MHAVRPLRRPSERCAESLLRTWQLYPMRTLPSNFYACCVAIMMSSLRHNMWLRTATVQPPQRPSCTAHSVVQARTKNSFDEIAMSKNKLMVDSWLTSSKSWRLRVGCQQTADPVGPCDSGSPATACGNHPQSQAMQVHGRLGRTWLLTWHAYPMETLSTTFSASRVMAGVTVAEEQGEVRT